MVNQRWFAIPPGKDGYNAWRVVDENKKLIGFFYEKEDAIKVVDNHNNNNLKEQNDG